MSLTRLPVCLLLSINLPTAPATTDLRLLPPESLPGGRLQFAILRTDGTPWTPELAGATTLLSSASLDLPPDQWQPATGPRTLAGQAILIDHPLPASPAFFLARQHPLQEPVLVHSAAALRTAVEGAVPGSRIRVAPGTYAGGFFFVDIHGEPGRPIVIAAADPQSPPVFQGGGNGMQFVRPRWLELDSLTFSGATGNGLNIDDGGTPDTPARHVSLRRLVIRDVGPQGNRDGIKLSGVVDIEITDCLIERWGTAGSAIDMVGCHRGTIAGNLFRHTTAGVDGGASGVQAKGGTSDILIRGNRFEHAGARSVNLGGSTGIEFFRPPLVPGHAHSEAARIVVEGNTFTGSTAPIAFVGVDGATVRFNTLHRPGRWALRILQETTAEGFVPCRNGVFTDNIVVFHSSQWSAGGINIGAGTAPQTFQFARNWWFCLDNPALSQPSLPVAEADGMHGLSPLFIDEPGGDLRLRQDSPARHVGAEACCP